MIKSHLDIVILVRAQLHTKQEAKKVQPHPPPKKIYMNQLIPFQSKSIPRKGYTWRIYAVGSVSSHRMYLPETFPTQSWKPYVQSFTNSPPSEGMSPNSLQELSRLCVYKAREDAIQMIEAAVFTSHDGVPLDFLLSRRWCLTLDTRLSLHCRYSIRIFTLEIISKQ